MKLIMHPSEEWNLFDMNKQIENTCNSLISMRETNTTIINKSLCNNKMCK